MLRFATQTFLYLSIIIFIKNKSNPFKIITNWPKSFLIFDSLLSKIQKIYNIKKFAYMILKENTKQLFINMYYIILSSCMQSMYKGSLRGLTPLLFNWVTTLKHVSHLNFDIFPLFHNERLNWHNSILLANFRVPCLYWVGADLYLSFSFNQLKSNHNFLF